jgi:hypothetical protein
MRSNKTSAFEEALQEKGSVKVSAVLHGTFPAKWVREYVLLTSRLVGQAACIPVG